MTELTDFTPVTKLTKDASRNLVLGRSMAKGSTESQSPSIPSLHEARLLVDMYYNMQEQRKRLANQIGAIDRGSDHGSHEAADYLLEQATTMEDNARSFLYVVASNHPMSPWFDAVHGIGPVLAAGFISSLGTRPVPPTVGHWWRFAGLDPSVNWMNEKKITERWKELDGSIKERADVIALEIGRDPKTVIRDAMTDFKSGEIVDLTKNRAIKSLCRRPWNAFLKTLCWKFVDVLVKLGYKDEALYAMYYRARKAEEIRRNERGDRRDLALRKAAQFPNHAQIKTYQDGKLPDGHVDAMARRATAKMFLSHLHELWYQVENGTLPPKPFAISIQGHAHYLEPFYKDAVL